MTARIVHKAGRPRLPRLSKEEKAGKPRGGRLPFAESSVDALLSRVSILPSGCWEWQGSRSEGYGKVSIDGRLMYAHRYAYELMVGPIPIGTELDHLCRNRACINTEHLEPVTHRVNVRRGTAPAAINATKTHCPYGHLYEGDNLFIRQTGARTCRTCKQQWDRAFKAKQREVRRPADRA